jgi:predicted DNA-binding antitoxin AbrB/MazE fold protein
MVNAIPAIYENGVLRPLVPVQLQDRQTVWLKVLPQPLTEPQPDQVKTELQSALQPLYESGLLIPPTKTSNAPPMSEAEVVAMAQSIKVTGKPLSETVIEDRGEW